MLGFMRFQFNGETEESCGGKFSLLTDSLFGGVSYCPLDWEQRYSVFR